MTAVVLIFFIIGYAFLGHEGFVQFARFWAPDFISERVDWLRVTEHPKEPTELTPTEAVCAGLSKSILKNAENNSKSVDLIDGLQKSVRNNVGSLKNLHEINQKITADMQKIIAVLNNQGAAIKKLLAPPAETVPSEGD